MRSGVRVQITWTSYASHHAPPAPKATLQLHRKGLSMHKENGDATQQ
jgi:hypothetical protein